MTGEVAAEALQTVIDHLKANASAAAKAIESITNPAALTVITNPEVTVTDKENGKASVTFTYEFGVSDLAIEGENVIVKVELGVDHIFADGTTVTVVNADGTAITDIELVDAQDGDTENVRRFRFPYAGGNIKVKAKAEKK